MSMLFSRAFIAYNAPEPPLPTFSVRPPMSEIDDRVLAPRVRTMQIIAIALIAGVLVFLGIACNQVFVQRQGQPQGQADALPILSLLAVAMLAGGAAVSFVLPMVMTRAALQKIAAGTWQLPQGIDPKDLATDVAKLLTVKQTTLIFSLAMLEGPAFLGCIAFLIEARPFTLGLVGVAIAMMLFKFPTEGGIRAWLWNQTNQLEQARQGGHPPVQPR
jgi:hypothetical protein